MSVMILVEAANFAVLLANNTILDIIMNFLALVIISEFDDYFFSTVKNEPIGELISKGEVKIKGKERELEDFLRIETTSSGYADHQVKGNELKP